MHGRQHNVKLTRLWGTLYGEDPGLESGAGSGDTENGYMSTVEVSTRRVGEAVEIRVSDPATYCSSTPRIQPPAVARWHTLLHSLATEIREISGLGGLECWNYAIADFRLQIVDFI